MIQKIKTYLLILSIFNFFSTTPSSHHYKSSKYYVACCPDKCCCSFCCCNCNSCDHKPCLSWDEKKRRVRLCIYAVLEESGRLNEKGACMCSCNSAHYACTNSITDLKNCIGGFYDWIRHCKTPGIVEKMSCDCCGCCIRKIEISTEPAIIPDTME